MKMPFFAIRGCAVVLLAASAAFLYGQVQAINGL
jgi:hypothetical protein